jgi:hypothetical protein
MVQLALHDHVVVELLVKLVGLGDQLAHKTHSPALSILPPNGGDVHADDDDLSACREDLRLLLATLADDVPTGAVFERISHQICHVLTVDESPVCELDERPRYRASHECNGAIETWHSSS